MFSEFANLKLDRESLSPPPCCRYAFTPLIDDSDDEEVEEFLVSANIGEAWPVAKFLGGFFALCEGYFIFALFLADGIKLRAAKTETNGTMKPPVPAVVSISQGGVIIHNIQSAAELLAPMVNIDRKKICAN